MAKLKSVVIAALLAAVSALQGCAFMLGAAAGGAGYMLKDQGYEVQSLVTKED
jgi:hypothetical protein